jgi:hypothetical protein
VLHRAPLLIGESRRSSTQETLTSDQLSCYIERSKSFESAFIFTSVRAEENAWKNLTVEDKERILSLELTSAHTFEGGSLVPCFVEDVEYLTRLFESEEIDYRVIQAHLKLSSVFTFWQKFKNHVNRFSEKKEKLFEVKARIAKVYEPIDLSRHISVRQRLQFSGDCKELKFQSSDTLSL